MSLWKLLTATYDGTNTDKVRIDASTNTLQTIAYAHHEVHSGCAYTFSYKADIGNGNDLYIMLRAPNTAKWNHFTYEFDVEAESDVEIYEDITAVTGTALVIYNRDRNNTTTAGTLVWHTPTAITTGTTLIRSYHLGSGKSTGGGARGVHEFILKQDTDYLIHLNNATTSNNYMAVKGDWYEHENKH